MKHPLMALWLCAALPVAGGSLELAVNSEMIPERGLVTQYLLKTPAGRFAMNPPPNWIVRFDDRRESVSFQSSTGEAVLVLRFLASPAARPASDLLEVVKKQSPFARIQSRFTVYSRDAEGQAVEFDEDAPPIMVYRKRLALLRYPAGSVEVALRAPVLAFAGTHSIWTSVLNSIRRIEPGESANNSLPN